MDIAAGAHVVERQRLTGALWLIAGASSGLIAFYITDAPTLAVFVAGTLVGIGLGLGFLFRPAPALRGASLLAGTAWLLAYGVVIVVNLRPPLAELFSVVWVAAFGVAAASVSYRRRPGPSRV